MKRGRLSDSEFCPFSGSGGSDACRKSIPLCNENGGCILSGNGEKIKTGSGPVTLKYEEIEENRKNGKMSALLTLEEGEICEGDPAPLLRDFYRMGARMMTLTWNYPNQFDIRQKRLAENLPEKSFQKPDMGLQRVGLSFWKRWRNWE